VKETTAKSSLAFGDILNSVHLRYTPLQLFFDTHISWILIMFYKVLSEVEASRILRRRRYFSDNIAE